MITRNSIPTVVAGSVTPSPKKTRKPKTPVLSGAVTPPKTKPKKPRTTVLSGAVKPQTKLKTGLWASVKKFFSKATLTSIKDKMVAIWNAIKNSNILNTIKDLALKLIRRGK